MMSFEVLVCWERVGIHCMGSHLDRREVIVVSVIGSTRRIGGLVSLCCEINYRERVLPRSNSFVRTTGFTSDLPHASKPRNMNEPPECD